jgi:hypothetical protein
VVAINGWNRLAASFRAEPSSYQPRASPAHPTPGEDAIRVAH